MSAVLGSPFVRYAVLSAALIVVTAAVPGAPGYGDGLSSARDALVVAFVLAAGLLARLRVFWYLALTWHTLMVTVYAAAVLEAREENPVGPFAHLIKGADQNLGKAVALTVLGVALVATLLVSSFERWLSRRTVAVA